jgi:hypothetical protein
MSAFASLKAVAAYCPQARALFARLATPPAPARAAAYDAMIRALLAAGVWSKLDALYLLAAADAATALTNLKQSSYGLTAVNSPAFTADRGYTGNGTTQYLNPGFTPSTASGQYTQNSASIFWWMRTRITVGAGADAVGVYRVGRHRQRLFGPDGSGHWHPAQQHVGGRPFGCRVSARPGRHVGCITDECK